MGAEVRIERSVHHRRLLADRRSKTASARWACSIILDDCYDNQNAESCALVFRNADYSINHVNDFPLNVADQGAEGIDTEIRYSLNTEVGKFSAELLWSHNLARTKTPFPGSDEIELVGRYTDPTAEDGGAYAEDKVNYSFKWFWKDLLLGYSGEFVSSLAADTLCNCGDRQQPGRHVYADDRFDAVPRLLRAVHDWSAPRSWPASPT